MLMTLERETVRAEWNHTCVPGVCPPGCTASQNKVEVPETVLPEAPQMQA